MAAQMFVKKTPQFVKMPYQQVSKELLTDGPLYVSLLLYEDGLEIGRGWRLDDTEASKFKPHGNIDSRHWMTNRLNDLFGQTS